MTVGMRVIVFGCRPATVDAVSANGKRVHVSGPAYSGWTSASNVKATS